MTESHLVQIRKIMAEFPTLEFSTPGKEIKQDEIYFPKSHAAALDPDRSLVVGNRGMGKTFWASALVQSETREVIAQRFPESKLGRGGVDVHFGFADAEGSVGISRDELANLLAMNASVEAIWRAITLEKIAKVANASIPPKLSDRIEWVVRNPEDVREILRAADRNLTMESKQLVFVFDQLEQLSDNLDHRRGLTQGILRLALAYKSYRNLRIKIFMRPDQASDETLFGFPDASKISGERVDLDWRPYELYGLLYARLRRSNAEAFDAIVKAAGIAESPIDSRTGLPQSLVADARAQHTVFDLIAGEAMGAALNRGRPYLWLVLHLADARNQVSPRTFLRALTFAAKYDPAPTATAINYHGINEGVRKASENRVDDLREDYPWVYPALKVLKGLRVPCVPQDFLDRWREEKIIGGLKEVTLPAKTPAWLDSAHEDNDDFLQNLLTAMVNIGVIEHRQSTGKIDVPDIFRLPADIRRKGGVTPQQRLQMRTR